MVRFDNSGLDARAELRLWQVTCRVKNSAGMAIVNLDNCISLPLANLNKALVNKLSVQGGAWWSKQPQDTPVYRAKPYLLVRPGWTAVII